MQLDVDISRAGLSDAQARLAGLLYLGTIIAGLFAELAVRSMVRAGDAATTALNIAEHQGLYRAGEAADLVMLCCYVAVTGLLYRLFAPAARATSVVAAGFSLIGIAVLAVAGVFHLAPLNLPDGASIARNALILHGNLYNISLIFFGVYCVLIGCMCIRTRLLPWPVGGLMLIGGLAHIAIKFLWVLSPDLLQRVPTQLNMLPLIGETALALWLLAFGLRGRGVATG